MMSKLPLIFSILALSVALYGTVRTPPASDRFGSGLAAYNLNSPTNALSSQLEMTLNRDFLALWEFSMVKENTMAKIKEQKDTIEIHRESNYQGKKLLFISYIQNGLDKKEVVAFEQPDDDPRWFLSRFSRYSMKDGALKNAVDDWEKDGRALNDLKLP